LIGSAPNPAKQPDAINLLLQQAVQLHQDGDRAKAEILYRQCLQAAPHLAIVWSNYGALLREDKKFKASVANLRRALELDPTQNSIRSNLANALYSLGEFHEAIELREQLVTESPDNVEHIRMLAAALRGAWLNQEAIELVDDAEARLGPSSDFILQRGLAHLMLGHYRRGFKDFETRFDGPEISLPEDVLWPRWNGEPLEGKKIVVFPEQGFGDFILASRFLPALKAMGPQICLLVKKPLLRLVGKVQGVDELRDTIVKSEQFDYYTPALSLPYFTGLTHDNIPPPPQLTIPDDCRAKACRTVAPYKNRFRIGVVWTGSQTYLTNHRRSTKPESFLGLARIPGVQLFSLYKGEAHADYLNSGVASLIADACGDDRDFADTAAIIDEMDLMITTDTAVVHIAASLGKPVWNLLSYEGFWLYGAEDTTPWYPSMRLFRQTSVGGWDELFERVETELRRYLDERRP